MNSNVKLVLAALVPMLEPAILEEFDNAVVPELAKAVQGVGSPDLKVLAAALVSAFQTIGNKEIPAAAAKLE